MAVVLSSSCGRVQQRMIRQSKNVTVHPPPLLDGSIWRNDGIPCDRSCSGQSKRRDQKHLHYVHALCQTWELGERKKERASLDGLQGGDRHGASLNGSQGDTSPGKPRSILLQVMTAVMD
ncbi:hypothetical protein H107_06638 [Trichophyton rubrum CBS 202.88]|nr:hypothetical protein H102_06466 [Trichophyton rubrum CBS 100081]EZF60610.1 hypothetical protein H104_06476 [Trichophyton rubrum CBS 289.86]EZG14094.1 hypothetical protein H107_06638 [Trichophyton rubrum CBS 202.88]KMQ48421.1 hypothetical protein HL42_0874 [Trichophyton rubrum]